MQGFGLHALWALLSLLSSFFFSPSSWVFFFFLFHYVGLIPLYIKSNDHSPMWFQLDIIFFKMICCEIGVLIFSSMGALICQSRVPPHDAKVPCTMYPQVLETTYRENHPNFFPNLCFWNRKSIVVMKWWRWWYNPKLLNRWEQFSIFYMPLTKFFQDELHRSHTSLRQSSAPS